MNGCMGSGTHSLNLALLLTTPCQELPRGSWDGAGAPVSPYKGPQATPAQKVTVSLINYAQ